MHWDNYERVYMAYELRGSTKRETTDGSEYEGRLRIGCVDVTTRFSETFDYYYE